MAQTLHVYGSDADCLPSAQASQTGISPSKSAVAEEQFIEIFLGTNPRTHDTLHVAPNVFKQGGVRKVFGGRSGGMQSLSTIVMPVGATCKGRGNVSACVLWGEHV
jgi:hypothetical protein